jgi:hypothetical protein
MAKIANNRYTWADEIDEEGEYDKGRFLPANTKMIAFWIHVIDNAFYEIENNHKQPKMSTITKAHVHQHVAPSLYTWLGAAREGYQIIFSTMPHDVRTIVSDYFDRKNVDKIALRHILVGKGYPLFYT